MLPLAFIQKFLHAQSEVPGTHVCAAVGANCLSNVGMVRSFLSSTSCHNGSIFLLNSATCLVYAFVRIALQCLLFGFWGFDRHAEQRISCWHHKVNVCKMQEEIWSQSESWQRPKHSPRFQAQGAGYTVWAQAEEGASKGQSLRGKQLP